MITRHGICYDLNISEYRFTIDNLTYVFSSQLHLEKFKDRLHDNRDIINYSLSRRFNFPVQVNELADMVLYKKIESRGFLVIKKNGEKLSCQKEIKFVGGQVMNKNSNE